MNLAVIPARGGSRRIPRKNIRLFCGRPMIAWSIEAALASGCFDDVVVSTDDDEIAAIATSEGASVPFTRPAELADDFTPTIPVVAHAITAVAPALDPAQVCCIYATAAFVTPERLRQGLELMAPSDRDYVFTATTFPFPIQRALRLEGQGVVAMFPEFIAMRSQDLVTAIHDAGQFYWGRKQAWLEGRTLFSEASAPLLVPRAECQDVDTEEDWELAEHLRLAMQRKRSP